ITKEKPIPLNSITSKKVKTNQKDKAMPTKSPADAIAGVKITHPDRIIYEKIGLTKLELAKFYEDIADQILPHIINRPLALVRCPEGSSDECFFQKNHSKYLPEQVQPVTLDKDTEGIQITDLEGLIALVQFGVLEIHPWGSQSKN